MNAKIKKIDTEYEKNAARIAELQTRQKELENSARSMRTWTSSALCAAWA